MMLKCYVGYSFSYPNILNTSIVYYVLLPTNDHRDYSKENKPVLSLRRMPVSTTQHNPQCIYAGILMFSIDQISFLFFDRILLLA